MFLFSLDELLNRVIKFFQFTGWTYWATITEIFSVRRSKVGCRLPRVSVFGSDSLRGIFQHRFRLVELRIMLL